MTCKYNSWLNYTTFGVFCLNEEVHLAALVSFLNTKQAHKITADITAVANI